MRKKTVFLLTIVLPLILSACGEPTMRNASSLSSSALGSNAESASSIIPTQTSAPLKSPEDTLTPAETPATENHSERNTNILVAVFSLAGEQYGVGVIEEGNTKIVADMIAEQTGADRFDITPVISYPETIDELLDISQQEKSGNVRPEIAENVDNMENYDVVFIGYPNWWGDMPMIVYSFLEYYDFSGKTIVPFCTHGGSGFSSTENTIAEITGANMLAGLAVRGETAQNQRDETQADVIEWLREGGFVD